MNPPIPFPEPRVTRLSLVKRGETPRRFTIRYTVAKTLKERSNEQHKLWGCRFPNGCITLENLAVFESMHELEAHFERAGAYSIDWFDE